MQTLSKRLGIIAGSGSLPVILAGSARKMGYYVSVIAHQGLTSSSIEEEADSTTWIKIGQLSKLIRRLKREDIAQVVMAGSVSKRLLFSQIRPDIRALALLTRLKDKNDDTILRGLAEELEKEGFQVCSASFFISPLIAPEGRIGKHEPTLEEWKDIRFAFPMAKEIGRLDIGQCIVVKDQAVLAVETIEGTDETIKRGGKFARGAIVIKICKPGQDMRFDLPTIGPTTIQVMKEVGARVLAVEAGMTIILDRDITVKEADMNGISIVGIKQ